MVTLVNSHHVGIYEADTSRLVTRAIVPSGATSPLEGNFRFIPVPYVQLTANKRYRVDGYRGFSPGNKLNSSNSEPIAHKVNGLSTSPLVGYEYNVAENDTAGLTVGDGPWNDFNNSWFGGNLKAF